MFLVAVELAGVIRRSDLGSEGINLFYADGEAAFQEVFHSHLHVFPHHEDDGFRNDADWSVRPSCDELDVTAGAIRRALGD